MGLTLALIHIPLGIALAVGSAVAAGLFGLQYTTMRRYTVSNASFLSVIVATIIVPPIFVSIMCPGWPQAIQEAGLKANVIMMLCGFGWGLGAITYAYGFNILGMALAAALIKGISIAVGSGYALSKNIEEVEPEALQWTLGGLAILLAGTALGGLAGVMREKEMEPAGGTATEQKSKTTGMFIIGMVSCLVSGVFSACVALGWTEGQPVSDAMTKIAGEGLETWKADFVRWIPIYFGGFLSIFIFMGGAMIQSGAWRNFSAPGSGRDFTVASSMGAVHFCAHLTFGLSTFFLGAALGDSVGFALHIALALLVAAGIGFYNGEWATASKKATSWIGASIVVLILAVVVLAYGTFVQSQQESGSGPESPAVEAETSES